MSFSDKVTEITKDQWMTKVESHHVTRAEMNTLIMNYLETGTPFRIFSFLDLFLCRHYVALASTYVSA